MERTVIFPFHFSNVNSLPLSPVLTSFLRRSQPYVCHGFFPLGPPSQSPHSQNKHRKGSIETRRTCREGAPRFSHRGGSEVMPAVWTTLRPRRSSFLARFVYRSPDIPAAPPPLFSPRCHWWIVQYGITRISPPTYRSGPLAHVNTRNPWIYARAIGENTWRYPCCAFDLLFGRADGVQPGLCALSLFGIPGQTVARRCLFCCFVFRTAGKKKGTKLNFNHTGLKVNKVYSGVHSEVSAAGEKQ